MNKNIEILESIKTYFAINPLPIFLINILNNFLILLYFVSFLFNFIHISVILFNELEHYILYVNNNQNNENPKNNFENNNSPNNFNDGTYTYYDTREKPKKKTYFLADGRIVSLNGDNISSFEMWKRKNLSGWIKGINEPYINANLRRYENFTSISTIVNEFNLGAQMLFNRKELLENIQNKGIYASLNWPINKKLGFIGAGSYMFWKEGCDTYHEIIYNTKRPDSEITQIWNKHSPFQKSTYCENDTWDDDILANDVVYNIGCEVVNTYKEKIESKCEIF